MCGRCSTINDIENEVFTPIAQAVRTQFTGAFVTGELLSAAPTKFPCVALVEMDNYAPKNKRDSSGVEQYSNVTYLLSVYSNKVAGKKAECKEIFQFVDQKLIALGFNRESITPQVPINEKIYWQSGRYTAQVKDKTIYNF